MDFDEAKENIQPLAQGRNASILQASIKVDCQQELMAQRKELEREIHNYSGDDPLSAWYTYIDWIEQSFPPGGKESGLQEVLAKCLSHFESDERYFQDRRMIKLYIKYIDSHKEPAECYQQLFNAGIGTMVSDLYIAWAYCYDLVNNTRKADEIFRRGIACRAQPFEELQEAHQHFGFAVAQRLLYKDDDSIKEETNRQLHERRLALSSLHGHRRKQLVGSIRTGAAVKNLAPGIVKNDGPSSSHRRNSNAQVKVFSDENEFPNVIPTTSTSASAEIAGASHESRSVVRSIIEAQRDQENLKEPGPWNKPHKKGKLFAKTKVTNELGFEIHEDENEDEKKEENEEKPCVPIIPISQTKAAFDKPFKFPPNFCERSRPQTDWITPVTTEEKADRNTLPEYNKCKLYPRTNKEFQVEEYKAYVALKKHCISNIFTKRCDVYWGRGPEYSIRQYPHFAKESIPQTVVPDTFLIPQKIPGLQLPFDDIYNEEEKVERQYEEILAMRIKRNETIIKTTDMEETICVSSEKVQRRKSFYPMRKSMAPCASNRGATRKVSIMPGCVEEGAENSNGTENRVASNQSSTPAIFEDREEVETPKILSKLQRQPCLEQPKKYQENEDAQSHHDTQQSKDQEKIVMSKMFSNMQHQPEVDVDDAQTKCTPQAFQIFQDESFVAKPKTDISSNQPSAVSPNGKDEYQFKAPVAPRNSNLLSVAKPSKTQFEIFEDNAANNNAKPDLVYESGGYFDPDETCSTQTFNIFLRAQSVSTPKPKPEPQRQFGNILKESVQPPPTVDLKDEEQATGGNSAIPDNSEENGPVAVTVFSPQRKQLSTILETSENGTTQSTHTTGATTKSSISSPEYDQESQAQTQHIPTLDTVKERTLEKSDTVEDMLSSMKIASNQLDVSKNEMIRPKVPPPPCTPGVVRSEQTISKPDVGGCLNFSIFEDSPRKNNHAGNFSRLEEKEDTTTGYAIRPVRFQEDKTETISKVLLAPQQPAKFQEDKTETISAVLLVHSQHSQDDKTETISKMLIAPPQPVRFQDDKTETESKFMLTPPLPLRFGGDKTETLPKLSTKDNIIVEPEGKDDFFEFFSQSPPKATRTANANSEENGSMSYLRPAAENMTPLTMASKRYCDRDTPNVQKTKPKPAPLFGDEKMCTEAMRPKSVLRDSFIPDFSLIENSQPKPGPSKIVKPTSVLRDSFIPDFSIIESSQPQKQPPQISETQPICNNSMIPNSQPMGSTSNRMKLQNSLKNALHSSFLPDFSCIPETQPSLSSGGCSNEGQPSGLKNILTDTFMKDFSKIKEPPPIPKDVKEFMIPQQNRNNSTLKFLEESVNQKSNDTMPNSSSNNTEHLTSSGAKENKLSFLTPKSVKKSAGDKKFSEGDKFFEPNAETEMFGTNISTIRNSTWLPNHGPGASVFKQPPQIQEQSIHIKHELSSPSPFPSSANRVQATVAIQKPISFELPKQKLSFLEKSNNAIMSAPRFSIDVSQSELDAINAKKEQKSIHSSRQTTVDSHITDVEDADDGDMSIYYKHTPKTPKAQVHVWDDDDDDAFKTPANNRYTHAEIDLNQTHQVLEHFRVDPNANPFSVDLINAFLEQIQFANYIENIPHCMLVGRINRLKANTSVKVNSVTFEVTKLIGEGAYGAVFCGKESTSGKKVALKQEKPPNFWEYYICLEIQDRIRADEMLPAFMSVDYALIGNNSSILISQFSQYGSIITVCNKIKKHTLKNVDEYVVMLMACELLEILDHLHAVSIIHADIKADNFLLMNNLEYPSKRRFLQLIDFGVSIDMKLFKQNQKFSYVHSDNSFKCVEMREQRPWTYQLDLYGLAGVLHVLLFGKYMEVAKKPSGIWMHKTHVPRYFNRDLWETIFKTLLNIRDCNSMPNLQHLRALLKEEIEEKEKYVIKMVNEFNRALDL